MNRSWVAFFAMILLAIAVHIVVIFAIPYLADDNAWQRLARLGSVNHVVRLPSPTPYGAVLPDMDPHLSYAMCRFDLSKGPLMIIAKMPPAYWSAAFYDRRATNYYSLNNRAGRDGQVELWVALESQLLRLSAKNRATDERLVVKAPDGLGFVIFRALVPDASYAGLVASSLEKTYCTSHPG